VRSERCCWVCLDNVAVEEGLKIVIAVVGDLRRVEDGINIGHGTEMTGTGLVVDDTDALFAADGIRDAVEAVDDTTGNGIAQGHVDGELKAEDSEGRQTTVGLNKQTYITNDDLAVDELESIDNPMIQFAADGGIDSAADSAVVLKKSVEQGNGDTTIGKLFVEGLGCLMEDVSKEAVVDKFLVGVVGLLEVADVTVEEAQLATQIIADGRGTDTSVFLGETLLEDVEDGWGLGDR